MNGGRKLLSIINRQLLQLQTKGLDSLSKPLQLISDRIKQSAMSESKCLLKALQFQLHQSNF